MLTTRAAKRRGPMHTHHSAYFWCRAIGWYGMTLVDTLDVLPKNQPGRGKLVRILRDLVAGLARRRGRKTTYPWRD